MIECPTCKRELSGMDCREGRLFEDVDRSGHFRQSVEAVCDHCGQAVYAVRLLTLSRQIVRTTTVALEVRETRQRLGLSEPMTSDLGGQSGV